MNTFELQTNINVTEELLKDGSRTTGSNISLILVNQLAIMHALVELLERVTAQDVVAQAIRTCEQVTGKPVGPVIPQTPRQPTEPGPPPPIQSSDGPQS